MLLYPSTIKLTLGNGGFIITSILVIQNIFSYYVPFSNDKDRPSVLKI